MRGGPGRSTLQARQQQLHRKRAADLGVGARDKQLLPCRAAGECHEEGARPAEVLVVQAAEEGMPSTVNRPHVGI